MPKNINFTIKYIIAIIAALLIGTYIAIKVISDAFDIVSLEFSLLLKITFFISISFAALIIINLLYYFWFTYLSSYSIIAKKHGFKRIGFMNGLMMKTINNIEYNVYTFGHLADRNIIFRTELGLIINNKSKKNKLQFSLSDYSNIYSKYFDKIHEINKNTTVSFKKVDYFRDVDLIEYFNTIDEIIQKHEPVDNQTEKGVNK